MALNSIGFLLFLGGVCVVSYMVPGRFRFVWLLVCSYTFYVYDPVDWRRNLPALALLVLATLVSYLCALGLQTAQKQGPRRALLAVSLLCCLGLLFLLKYFNFFVATAGGTLRLNLLLPLGISYYTLQTASYSLDVYHGDLTAEKNLLRYALYVSFFPGIVTGPINRAPDMLPQYADPPRFDYSTVAGGFFRVLWGFFKKMVIADNIGVLTAAVLGAPAGQPGPVLAVTSLLFAYQLYADFGGCCDIAIGAARMLGFRFMENFNRPFAAKTFPGLWQRWHISLTSFLRDYLFTPLVWSRWTEKLPLIGHFFTKPPMYSATILVFAVSGLWHGANVNYVAWGLANGVLMVAAQALGKRKERFVKQIPFYRNRLVRGFVQRVLVYGMFSLCLVFFSAGLYGSSAAVWFSGVVQGWAAPFAAVAGAFAANGLAGVKLLALAAGVLLVELCERSGVHTGANGTMADWIRRRNFMVRWPLYYALIIAVLALGAFGRSPFIYQQY